MLLRIRLVDRCFSTVITGSTGSYKINIVVRISIGGRSVLREFSTTLIWTVHDRLISPVRSFSGDFDDVMSRGIKGKSLSFSVRKWPCPPSIQTSWSTGVLKASLTNFLTVETVSCASRRLSWILWVIYSSLEERLDNENMLQNLRTLQPYNFTPVPMNNIQTYIINSKSRCIVHRHNYTQSEC